MSAPSVFDTVAEALRDATGMDELATRGTLRLALRKAGLDARAVDASAMRAVIDKLLPDELGVRGIEDAAGICARLTRCLADAPAPGPGPADDRASSAAAIFQRLSGS